MIIITKVLDDNGMLRLPPCLRSEYPKDTIIQFELTYTNKTEESNEGSRQTTGGKKGVRRGSSVFRKGGRL